MRLLLSSTFILLSFFLLTNTPVVSTQILCLDDEKAALLDFKLSFVVDTGVWLSSWTIANDSDCCNWNGVTCDGVSRHVVELDLGWGFLKSYQLRPSLLALHHLTSLDLSRNRFAMRIPNFLGSLKNLTALDLSRSGFHGEIPLHLGNLSNLQNLILGPSNQLWASNLQWLSPLSSIQKLDLSELDMSNAIDWVSTLKMLPILYKFTCKSCSLPSLPLSSISYVNSTSLESLDLSRNAISLSTFSSLINGSKNLWKVHLNHMQQEPYTFHGILEALASNHRYTLKDLCLIGNNLNSLPFEGVIFPSLGRLDVSSNRINSSFLRILQYLPTNLEHMDFSSNLLSGVIADAHLSKFSHVHNLILSNNKLLIFNFSKNWVPPFQLDTLYLGSSIVGPNFPDWILTQKMLGELDISDSMISSAIPDAFWNFSTRLSYLNISHNKIACKIPDLVLSYGGFTSIYLSSNSFYGPIPFFLFTSSTLDLSYNRFSKLSPFRSSLLSGTSFQINLSSNHLSGLLPMWLFQLNNPWELNLANNMLSGTLPDEIGLLSGLVELHLSKNRFTGQLPSSLKHCTQLQILELSSNNFSGSIPFWIGESMPHLIVLTLRSNNFSRKLPSSLCHLRSLQILDLSENQISGCIPSCIHNFTAMSTNKGWGLMSIGEKSIYYDENKQAIILDYASVMWKGATTNLYSRSLDQRTVINLSGNLLIGEIPIGVTTLKELRSLDLSRNGLNGSIPDQIGQMKLLELLNLSSNRLSGEIPKSLGDLTFLGTLNLSNNNLFGRIPSSTQLQGFDASSYARNPKLCGEPVSISCPGDEDGYTRHPLYNRKRDDQFDVQAFLAALGMGFAFGFLGVIGMLHYNRQFRLAFFHSIHDIVEKIIVTTTIHYSRIKRRLCIRKTNGVAVCEG